MHRDRWTEADFDSLTWHDNHVHGFTVARGNHGSGTLTFDLDFILEWLKLDSGRIGFRIAPAVLEFADASALQIHLDYATPTAELSPFSLDAIERAEEVRERYTATVWRLKVNWPAGSIRFEASGFEQRLIGEPLVTDQQVLSPQERARALSRA